MFSTGSAASQTCPSKGLNDDERLLILEEHNSRRSRIAKGLEKAANWAAPKASEMYKMVRLLPFTFDLKGACLRNECANNVSKRWLH